MAKNIEKKGYDPILAEIFKNVLHDECDIIVTIYMPDDIGVLLAKAVHEYTIKNGGTIWGNRI